MEERRDGGVNVSHVLLRGGTRKIYSHGLSLSQIQTLASITEAFVPNDLCPHSVSTSKVPAPQSPVSHEIAETMKTRLLPEAMMLVKLSLMLLSTRLGSLLLCGFVCLDWNWPFIHKFSELPLKKREEVLLKWSSGTNKVLPLRLVFALFKAYCCYTAFAWTDENSRNQACETIGYHVDNEEIPTKSQKERPLENGIIETKDCNDISFKKSLIQKGLEVTEDETAFRIKCDVVIVGSGCGGAVAAAHLASSGQKVVVLEKGNYFVAQDYSQIEGPSNNELFEGGGMLGSDNGRVMIKAGSTVGGGTSVNWSATLRTPDDVLKEWSEEQKLTFFGSSQYQEAMDAEAVILTGVKAEKFILGDDQTRKRCFGVVANAVSKNITKKLQIEARVTVSSCGALSTPPLMISSGLQNRNIGRNLHLHPVIFAWGHFPEQSSSIEGKSYTGGILTTLHKGTT
ncbi:hypothetical protein ACET3Z_012815 [Daucus carota]